MTEPKLAGLSKASQQKKQSALLKTEKAIARLLKDCRKITVRSVAKEAGVSVSYIYKYPELAYKIQRLRERQKYEPPTSDRSIVKTDRKEKQQQQEANTARQTNTKSNRSSSAQHLQKENARLTAENQRLQAELEYTRQQLEEAREFILNRSSEIEVGK